MPNLPDWIWASALGAAVTAVTLLVARGWRSPGLRWAPAAVAIGFVAACAKLELFRRFPPILSEEWLPCLAMGLGLIGLADARWKLPPILRWLIALAGSAGVTWMMFQVFRATVWTPQTAPWWLGGIALAMLAVWGSADQLERQSPAGFLLLAIVTMAAGVIAAMSGYVTLGPIAAALAGGCGIAFLFQLFAGHSRGVAMIAGPLLVAMLFLTLVAAKLTPVNLGLVLSALFLPHIITPLAGRRPRLAMILQIAIALIPLAVALVLAKRAFDAASAEMYG